MSLEISNAIAKGLPSSVKNALGKMSGEQQAVFEEEYTKKAKSPIVMLLLTIFFPIHHFLFGKIGLGLIYWLTIGGGGIWYFIEIFRISSFTKNYNEDSAKTILRDMKIMGS